MKATRSNDQTGRGPSPRLTEESGMLVGEYDDGSRVHLARIAAVAPDGVRQSIRITMACGRELRLACVPRPGTRQSDRVAWPATEEQKG